MKRLIIYLVLAQPSFAGDPWKTPQSQWTHEDAVRIMTSSPWAKSTGKSKSIVRWDSARPVQLAMAQLNRETRALDYQTSCVIEVLGLTLPEQAPKPAATLRAVGREPIQSLDARILNNTMFFFFPRAELSQPITVRLPFGFRLGDDIEFAVHIGGHDVKEKFSLARMTFLGKLEL
jgi:hypothetical protein